MKVSNKPIEQYDVKPVEKTNKTHNNMKEILKELEGINKRIPENKK